MADIDVENVLSQLTVTEKIDLLAGDTPYIQNPFKNYLS
jgi:hypothetical protein